MTENNERKIVFIVGGTFLVLVVGAWLSVPLFFQDSAYDQRGTFGDMYGSVNALFSGFAFVGIIITILLQSTELKLQREELSATRSEFAEQNKTMKSQRFETTFFNMINLHHSIVASIYSEALIDPIRAEVHALATTYKRVEGREAFSEMYSELIKKSSTGFNSEYKKFFETKSSQLGHYYTNLYQIYKFIDKSDIDDKKRYASIVKAQLSSYELIFLFYNCISSYGDKFRPLAIAYDLFDNMDKDKLKKREHFDMLESKSFN